MLSELPKLMCDDSMVDGPGEGILDYYELRGDCTEETESDIYNEFWLNW